jgi:chromosome segregation ATPase
MTISRLFPHGSAGFTVFDAESGASGGSGPLPPAAPATPPTAATAPDPAGQPDHHKQAEEWKSRSAGWQRTYETLKGQFDSLSGNYKALDDAHQIVVSEAENLRKQVTNLSAETATRTSDLATLTRKADRLDLIVRQAVDQPHLLQFADEILLFPEDGEAFSTRLTAFMEKVKELADSAAQNAAGKRKTGATPPPPDNLGSSDPVDQNALRKQAQAALKEGKSAEYTRLMDLYYQRLKEKGA